MSRTERIARDLCKINGIDPDQETSSIREVTKSALGNSYKLWQYWEHFYVKQMLFIMETNDA